MEPATEILNGWLLDARQRTLELIADLSDEQLRAAAGLAIVNPLLWEIGHLAWFHEKWNLRRQGQPSLLANADHLYDSTAIPHATRWDLPLPSRQQTLSYLERVQDRVLERLAQGKDEDRYFLLLSLYHEDMHTEAFFYTRQTLAFPAPARIMDRLRIADRSFCCQSAIRNPQSAIDPRSTLQHDVEVPGGTFLLGATPKEPFVHDNEKWAHEVPIAPFSIARTPVTQSQYADFVEMGGYQRPEFWDDEGWRQRQQVGAEQPVYWARERNGWLRRDFDRWVPLEPGLPMIHVNWYEACAYCRWAGRRLPTEAEWEWVASLPAPGEQAKRRFPWGESNPTAERAILDGPTLGCGNVDSCCEGEGVLGCRHLIGNVWEWTASTFLPYPGFQPDPYQEYSRPWFGTHKVLRGGCWATRRRLIRTTWRNYYRPDRRDVWAGFRTCALS
jgi:iron(II)-dependent oxidoreductase